MSVVLLTAAIALVLGALVGAATAVATHSQWRGRPGLGVAFGLTGFGLVSFAGFLVGWWAPAAGSVFSVLVVVASGAVLVARRAWLLPEWRLAARFALLLVGFLVADIGVLYLWNFGLAPLDLAAVRFFSYALPIDNHLPTFFADNLAAGRPSDPVYPDWQGSDRPPLQAGFILFVRGVTQLIGIDPTVAGFSAGFVAQLSLLAAVPTFVRSLGGTHRTALLSTIFVGISGTVLVNTLYSWPKLMSAALVIVAMTFLVMARRRPAQFGRYFSVAVVAFALGVLAHGAAALAIPMVVALGIIACRPVSRAHALVTMAGAGGAGLALCLPWLLFQRLVDPPGDRLLKWHLAGVEQVDPRPFGQALVDAYSHLTPIEWVAARVENVRALVIFNPLVYPGGTDTAQIYRRSEFFATNIALGAALPALVVILILIVRRIARRRLRLGDREVLGLAAICALAIAIWCLVMFTPGATIVHQGSHVWLIVLLIVPMLWLRGVARLVVLLAQLALTVSFDLDVAGPQQFSLAGLVVLVIGAGLVISTVVTGRRVARVA